MVGIINYGLGNLGSIKNMLKVIGEKSVISYDPDLLQKCDKLILPGVGSFDTGMINLKNKGLVDFIYKECLEKNKPILGICLGMQLLGRKSEEGKLKGLALIPFDNIKFNFEKKGNLKIPHMGWDIVDVKRYSPIVDNLVGIQRYYFVHTYHAVCDFDENVVLTCNYGYEFAAAVAKNNIYGVQFHPEKSHDFGMELLKNFVLKC